MKLRTQALWGVVPLFLMIGLAGVAASMLLKSHDWRLGAEEQARGMAVSLAEYLAGDQWPARSPAAEQRLREAETKLARWDFLREIRVWDAEGNLIHQWSVSRSPTEATTAATPWLRAEEANADNAFSISRLRLSLAEEDAVVHGGAVVWGEEASRLGWIECELDAPGWLEAIGWRDERNNQRAGVLEVMVVITLLGVLIALLFARLVRGDIQRLIRAAEKVGGGDYQPPPGMRVMELQDLSETFAVVDSLTNENRRKFQRSLIENEIFRTSEVLVEEFQAAAMPDIDQVVAGKRVVSRLFDKVEGSRWHGLGGDEQRGWLWLGSLAGPDGVERAAQALAVTTEFESLLLRQAVPAAAALLELGPLYQLKQAQVVTWAKDASEWEVWNWSAGSPDATRQVIPGGKRYLAHDLRGELATTIDLVWAGSASREFDVALAELEQVLGNTNAVVAALDSR